MMAAITATPIIQRSAGWNVEILRDGDVPQQVERDLLQRGVLLPFASRPAVGALAEYTPYAYLIVRDGERACIGGCALHVRAAPIPGHTVVRVEQFGSSLPLESADAVVDGIRHCIRRDARVLRLNIDVFSLDPVRRLAWGQVLARHGFRQLERPNNYKETLVTDLAPTEAELFAGLHHSARRKIRQLAKQALTIAPVDDPAYAGRMNALLLETFARTGGRIAERDWSARIALSRAHPDSSRIVGLFRTDLTGPEALLAYAWGCHSGDHVFYSEAASTRDTGEQRVAVAYGVMWDLILWARRTGARWFDFGGITRGTHTDDDPLGGISDFKRYFSQQIVHVRDEWISENHSWRASLAAAIHRRLRKH